MHTLWSSLCWRTAGTTALALLASLLPLAQAADAPRGAQTLSCLIEPNRAVDIGSPVVGTIEETLVERGQMVRKGEVLARLRANVERSAVTLARIKKDAAAELAAARANLELAKRKFERTQTLVQQNFLSDQALDSARTEQEIAERTVARAIEQQSTSDAEWQLAHAQLEQRIIRSPFDGVVVEKYLSSGERVDERPIVKVAAVNPLRIEVIVPAMHYPKFKPGVVGTVMPDLPEALPKEAAVSLVDKVIDSASNTFRVRMLLENTDNAVPAGVRCKVTFAVLGADTALQRPSKLKSDLGSLAPPSSLSRPLTNNTKTTASMSDEP